MVLLINVKHPPGELTFPDDFILTGMWTQTVVAAAAAADSDAAAFTRRHACVLGCWGAGEKEYDEEEWGEDGEERGGRRKKRKSPKSSSRNRYTAVVAMSFVEGRDFLLLSMCVSVGGVCECV